MVATTVVAADKRKGAVLKANASKASAKSAVAKTTGDSPRGESSKKATTATDALVRATTAKVVTPKKAAAPIAAKASAQVLPVGAQKSSKTSRAEPTSPPTAKATTKTAAKASAKSVAKASGKVPPAAKDGTSRSRAVTTPAAAARTPARPAAKAAPRPAAKQAAEAPVAKGTATTKRAASGKTASVAAKTAKAAKRPSPVRKAPGGTVRSHAARPGGGPGAKVAARKRIAEGYVKDERFLAGQRAALQRERATYIEQAASLKAEAESLVEEMEPGDIQFDDESGEGGTVTVDRERDLALSAQALAAVEEIDHTLAKMDNGTYGICENCGRLILRARLEALPYARLCIDCKSGGLSRR